MKKGTKRNEEMKRLQAILKDLFPKTKTDTATEKEWYLWRETLKKLEEI